MFSKSLKKSNNQNTTDLITFTFAGLAMVGVVYGLARYSLGFFIPEFIEEFLLSHKQAGWVLSASYFSCLAAMHPSALLIAKYGPRISILGGGMFAAIGMGVIALSPNFIWLIIGVILGGFSAGFAYPAYSVAIKQRIAAKDNNLVYGWINSGTGFGIILVAPIILFVNFDWRTTWCILALIAFAIVVFNAATLEHLKPEKDAQGVSLVNMIYELGQRSARPLFISSIIFGLLTSSYWAFAVDFILLQTGQQSYITIFLIFLGGSGALGCMAGNIVNGLGLRKSFRIMMLANAVSIGVFPMVSTSLSTILLSAVLFGSTFIIGTAVHGIWALRLYPKNAAFGFATTFFLISLGQGLGAVLGGFVIQNFGHSELFAFCALLGVLLAFFPSSWFEKAT
ncbi:MAG: MFS transporter [Nitratireductor sp.]